MQVEMRCVSSAAGSGSAGHFSNANYLNYATNRVEGSNDYRVVLMCLHVMTVSPLHLDSFDTRAP